MGNMGTGASQADVALIMVPADGNFTTAIARGNHKAGEIQGQTRQHSRLINLLGVKQIGIGINKMVYKKDTTLGQTKEFAAQIQVLDIPNEIKVGYSPIVFVRCGRAACRISKLKWKMGKETGGKKMEDPHSLKSNEMAQCSFQPQQPLVCDTFKNCEGLSRVAFMDGNGVVMLGKVVSCERKEEADKGGGKKK